MKTFEYRGFDASGRAAKGLVEALDVKDARERLAGRDILPERIHPVGESRVRPHRLFRDDFGLPARAMAYREIGALVRSGLPLAQVLEVLISAPEMGDSRSKLADIRDRVREGSSFADALVRSSPKVGAFEKAVIEVGERSGTLDEVLSRLAGFLDEQQTISERIQTALIYPAIVFSVAVAVAVLMLGLLITRVTKLLEESSIPLPLLTRVALGAGHWILPVLLAILAAGVLAAAVFRRRMKTDPGWSERVDRKLFRLPWFSRGYTALMNLRFARTLSILIRGGVPLVEGFAMAGRATGNAWITRLAVDGAESVRQGKSLAESVRLIEPLSLSLPGWIQVGEASGKLGDLLDNAAGRFQQQWEKSVARSLTVLEPVLVLGVGVFVLLVALSILLPILTLNRTLM